MLNLICQATAGRTLRGSNIYNIAIFTSIPTAHPCVNKVSETSCNRVLCRVARKPDRRKLIHISFVCDPVTYFTLSVVLQSTILGKSLLGCTLLCGILLRESLPARSTLTFASVAAILHTALIHAAEH